MRPCHGCNAHGSQTGGAVGGVGQTRSFDFERRLRQVVAGSTTTTYIYDGAGKRVAQVVTRNAQQPAATVYIGALYEEQVNPTDLPHSAYTSYYFLGATLVGLRRANQSASGQYRLVGDHLGSTTLLVDTSGPPTVVQRQYYTPYGTSAYQYTAHGSLTSVDFTGQRLDDSDGLLYFGARYYDAALSYFISADPTTPDPSRAADFEKYLYVRGNPLRFVDELGYGPDDHYIFVEGCPQGNVRGVQGCGTQDWHEYLSQLYDLYVHTWGLDWTKWDAWAFGPRGHVHELVARNVVQGAADIESAIAGISSSGQIHLIGHSEGGAAILRYFEQMRANEVVNGILPGGAPRLPRLDPRVASAVMIDSPLWCDGCHAGLGSWLAGKGVKMLDVDTQKDWVNHTAIPGIDYVGNPDYAVDIFGNPRPASGPDAEPAGPQGGLWPGDLVRDLPRRWDYHIWTSGHGARETGEFIRRVWR